MDVIHNRKSVVAGSFLAKGNGIYVTTLYLIVKILFIVNLVVQFVILNWFLGPKYVWWGYEILRDLLYGIEWETSGHFPRVLTQRE